MKLTTIAPFIMASALACASVGCASGDSAASDEGNLTAGGGVEFTSAVGAVVVDGKKVCTAALVDVDAGAHIGSVSGHGRQVVMGGACIGKFRSGLVGAAAFVTQQNGFQISTPIVSLDLESQASVGLAVGILSDPIPGAEPMDILGTSVLVNAGAHFASVIEANENGLLIGASAEIHAGVAFTLKTQCAQFSFAAQAGIAAGAAVSISKDGLGAAAFVKVNGRLHFAAHIDHACRVQRFGERGGALSNGSLSSANDASGQISSLAGGGKVIAVVETQQRLTPVSLRLDEDVQAIRINAGKALSATDSRGTSCRKNSSPCELRAPGGYKKGELLAINIDTGASLFSKGSRIVVSTTNDAGPPPSGEGGSSSGGSDPNAPGGGQFFP